MQNKYGHIIQSVRPSNNNIYGEGKRGTRFGIYYMPKKLRTGYKKTNLGALVSRENHLF
jgi:hypothetical protein